MARDCPDRQRGSDWRNNQGGFDSRRAIGGGDAVDREMEVSFSSLPLVRFTLISFSNSCKNCLVVVLGQTANLLAVLRLVPTKVTMTAI
jgi:hypothetical protein